MDTESGFQFAHTSSVRRGHYHAEEALPRERGSSISAEKMEDEEHPRRGDRRISPADWQPSVRPDEWTLAGQNLKRASSSKFPKNVLRKQRNRWSVG